MTEYELSAILKKLGLPVAYRLFETRQDVPFIVYYLVETESMGADDEMYFVDERYNVELYTAQKSPDLELQIESILVDNGIFYEKSEAYIEKEKVFEILYQI